MTVMISHVFDQCLQGVTKIGVHAEGTCFNVGWLTFPDVEWFYLDKGRVGHPASDIRS